MDYCVAVHRDTQPLLNAFLFTIITIAAAGCGRSETAPASAGNEPKPLRVDTVRRESMPRSVDVVGTLTPVDQVTISADTDGTVRRLHADLGDRVSAGAVVVELDREKQQYAYEQQQAALARALAQYGATDAASLPEVEKTPDVQRANADLVQATQAFERANELFGRALVSKQTLDDARAALESKRASYNGAVQGARNLRASIRASEAGVKLAAYLDAGHYYGVDVSAALLEGGRRELELAGVSDRVPTANLRVSGDFDLSGFPAFDFGIAQSVFTHLPPPALGACLRAIAPHFAPRGRFFATFFIAPPECPRLLHERGGVTTHADADPFHTHVGAVLAAAADAAWRARWIGEWGHPRDQQICELTPLA